LRQSGVSREKQEDRHYTFLHVFSLSVGGIGGLLHGRKDTPIATFTNYVGKRQKEKQGLFFDASLAQVDKRMRVFARIRFVHLF
jgi:hypothetical protein